MTKTDDYRTKLRALDNWDLYLLKESGLPGPRGNLELAQAVADEGNRQLFRRYIAYTADKDPVNSPYEFLAFCGIVGLGRLLAEGDKDLLKILRGYASDPRWRIREGVAMALQRLGNRITASLERADNRRSEDFLTLRQGLGYCWSVAVVALPLEGKALMEKWLVKSDKDIQWIMKENLKKARLARMDADWVRKWRGSVRLRRAVRR